MNPSTPMKESTEDLSVGVVGMWFGMGGKEGRPKGGDLKERRNNSSCNTKKKRSLSFSLSLVIDFSGFNFKEEKVIIILDLTNQRKYQKPKTMNYMKRQKTKEPHYASCLGCLQE